MSFTDLFSGPGPFSNTPNSESPNSLSKISSNLGNLLDPSNARLAVAGLAKGLVGPTFKNPQTSATWLNQNGTNQQEGPGGDNTDWRVTVSLADSSNLFYNDSNIAMLAPLKDTGGVVFPITPQIQTTHSAKYSNASLTHSNYAMQFYEGSEVGSININGEFPIQNIAEGQYLLSVIYFFRAATKMFWGGSDPTTGIPSDVLAGTPPPMLYLTGYGQYYFPKVPCVLTSFMHTLPEDKDYIEIPQTWGGTSTRLPTQSTIQIVLQPIYSRSSIAKFNLQSFAKGDMITGGFL